jgi:hypothetical protein
MGVSRRTVIKEALIACATSQINSLFARAADNCTTHVTPNEIVVAPRMPLEEFADTPRLVESLRRGVREMKKRKPSDPLSWFYQAAIHGVQLDPMDPGSKYYKAALDSDPDLAKVDQRFWNQCPHFGQNSADFLPWHRAYVFHFEQILREHTGESDFSLPYWNYEPTANRKFPKILGVEHLDGNLDNNAEENINPLFLKERDFYLTYYEHSRIPNMPLLELTDAVVDISLPMATDVFFGETEDTGLGGGIADDNPSTRGLLESYPHDNIHRIVGGLIPGGTTIIEQDGKSVEVDVTGAMAAPETAAFDPIFLLHHTNIDRLWVEWSCIPGKQWGKIPSASWFQQRPWFFFDAKGNCINAPRAAYFDHIKLGIRYKYEDPNCTPLILPDFPSVEIAAAEVDKLDRRPTERIARINASASIGIVQTGLSNPTRNDLITSLSALKAQGSNRLAQKRLLLRITISGLDKNPGMGFDVHFTASQNAQQLKRADRSFLGSIHLFVHGHHGDEVTQDFDITRAAGEIENGVLAAMNVIFVPVALTQFIETGNLNLRPFPLGIRRLELLVQDR